jgi:hypothetical protein
MRKVLILSLISIGIIGGVAVAQPKQQRYQLPDVNVVRESESEPSETPNYIYPDNSAKDKKDFDKVKSMLDKIELKQPGLVIKDIKLISYGNYLKLVKSSGGGELENKMVHPNRQMFLVVINAPQGLELPNRNWKRPENTQENKPKKLKKAKIHQLFDAETGEIWHSDIISVAELID